jgi:hypothetical protein
MINLKPEQESIGEPISILHNNYLGDGSFKNETVEQDETISNYAEYDDTEEYYGLCQRDILLFGNRSPLNH